jgi:hypothetical protein
VFRVHLPPGWAKFWWSADCIQYGNQAQASKKHSRFFSERIHAPADSFISKNEGMNEGRDMIMSCLTSVHAYKPFNLFLIARQSG